MSVASISFFTLALIFSSFFHWIPSAAIKRGLMAVLNVAFLATVVSDAPSLAALVSFLGSGYLAAHVLMRRPSGRLFAAYLVLLLAAFLVLKQYSIIGPFVPHQLLEHPVRVVGLSYILFRQVHFVVDVMQGQITRLSLWTYLQYQICLFTLLAGPIARYPRFQRDWQAQAPVLQDSRQVLRAYSRILLGVLAMALLARLALFMYEKGVRNYRWGRHVRIPLVLYSYPAYVYFNFAGYSSVVIGFASLFGLRLPENFDRPYKARNMIDYWNRWHITLGHWLRDYLFTPCYAALARHWPQRAKWMAPGVFFFVFLVAGIWHGSTMNFVIFGLLNGLGVSAAKTWENLILRYKGRKGLKAYMASKPIGTCARVLNFHFACVTFFFFPTGLTYCLEVLKSLLIGSPFDG